MQSNREGERRAALFVRNELPPPAREQARAVQRRLDDLATRGILDAVDVEFWEKRVPIADCAPAVRDTYLAFEAWATDAGARLTPFFQTRECYTRDGAETCDWLVVPTMCLAVYEAGDLAAVYPHARGDETAAVRDGLDAIGAESSPVGRPATLPAD